MPSFDKMGVSGSRTPGEHGGTSRFVSAPTVIGCDPAAPDGAAKTDGSISPPGPVEGPHPRSISETVVFLTSLSSDNRCHCSKGRPIHSLLEGWAKGSKDYIHLPQSPDPDSEISH